MPSLAGLRPCLPALPRQQTCPAQLLHQTIVCYAPSRLAVRAGWPCWGWRQEVTDSHQPQDQSMHWTRPAEAARRIASATGPSAHHRGTPSSIIHPSLAHAARSSLSRPVMAETWRANENYPAACNALALTTQPKSFLAAQPPAVVFLCSLGHALTTLPGPESETEVKLDQPHCSTSGKLPHARPGLPVNHRQVGLASLLLSTGPILLSRRDIAVKNATVAAIATQHRLAIEDRVDPHLPRALPRLHCCYPHVSLPNWRKQSPALSARRRRHSPR